MAPTEAPTETPTEPSIPENPKTGDVSNLNLRFTLLIISCGGFIITATCGKKKEETA